MVSSWPIQQVFLGEKWEKENSQARQWFKPSPMHKTTKAPPLGYDSNPQPYTLIRTTKHINKWNLCHRNQQDEIDTNRVAFLHFLIRIYKVNATCADHYGCRQALWMQNGANRWGVAPVHNNIAQLMNQALIQTKNWAADEPSLQLTKISHQHTYIYAVTIFEFNISQLRNQALNQTKICVALEPSLQLKNCTNTYRITFM